MESFNCWYLTTQYLAGYAYLYFLTLWICGSHLWQRTLCSLRNYQSNHCPLYSFISTRADIAPKGFCWKCSRQMREWNYGGGRGVWLVWVARHVYTAKTQYNEHGGQLWFALSSVCFGSIRQPNYNAVSGGKLNYNHTRTQSFRLTFLSLQHSTENTFLL